MAYTKQTWTDDVSAVTGARMTHIEDGIYANSTDVTTMKSALDLSGTATTTQTDYTEGQLTQKLGLKYIKMKGQTSQASDPTPSNPVDVNVVRGSNVLKVCNKNLFDKDDSSVIFNGFVNGSTSKLVSNANARTICLPCQPNTTYTVSKTSSQRFITGQTTSSTISDGIAVTISASTASMASQSVTTTADAKYVLVSYYLSTADTLSEETIRNSIQIEVGSTATTYTAHKEEDYEIDLPVENLFDYTKSTVVQNATVETINNIVKLTATSTVISGNLFYRTKIDDSLLTNGQSYTLSYEDVQNVNSPLKLQLRNHDGSYASGQSQADTVTYDSNYSLFVVGNPFGASTTSISSETVCIFKNVQVVRGTKTQAYTPYGTTPIELCKIGTCQDYIYKNNGKWYIHKEIGKKTVTNGDDFSLYQQNVGNNVYQYRTANNYLINAKLSPDPFNIEDIAYSNYFAKKNGINNLNNYYFTITGNGALAINTPYASINSLKTWLAGIDLKFYYELATATEEEITYEPLLQQLNKLDKIGLYDISNISQENSDMKMLLDFTICNDNYNGLREFIRS